MVSAAATATLDIVSKDFNAVIGIALLKYLDYCSGRMQQCQHNNSVYNVTFILI